jgi:hypothetical protein
VGFHRHNKTPMRNFFYFISKQKYLICDPEFCAKSKRTFDMSFFDLANNEVLLNKLLLYYIEGNYGVKYTYKSRAEWFSGYINAFGKTEGMHEKMLTNPTIRLLVEDEKLFEQVKIILT